VPICKKAQFKSCAFLFALKKIKPNHLSTAKHPSRLCLNLPVHHISFNARETHKNQIAGLYSFSFGIHRACPPAQCSKTWNFFSANVAECV
jgi:hypothetical protein